MCDTYCIIAYVYHTEGIYTEIKVKQMLAVPVFVYSMYESSSYAIVNWIKLSMMPRTKLKHLPHVVAWRGMAWRGVMWCGVVWRGMAWCAVVWRGVV